MENVDFSNRQRLKVRYGKHLSYLYSVKYGVERTLIVFD